MPAPSTSLEPLESKSDWPPGEAAPSLAEDTDLSPAFIHSGWRSARRRIQAALLDVFGYDSRLLRFSSCGTGGKVWRSETDRHHFKITANFCHDRWCQVCGTKRGHVIAANLLDHAKDRKLRFITLTLRQQAANWCHESDRFSCRSALNRLLASFSRLRETDNWNRCVDGGVAFVELKFKPATDAWNVHLHLVYEGRYYPKKQLAGAWLHATGDSFIVDIRDVQDDAHVFRYVTKYVSKGLDPSVIRSPSRLREAMRALHQRRTATTFGSWRGLNLTQSAPDDAWELIGSLADVLNAARDGNPAMLHIVNCLISEYRLPPFDRIDLPSPRPPPEPEIRQSDEAYRADVAACIPPRSPDAGKLKPSEPLAHEVATL